MGTRDSKTTVDLFFSAGNTAVWRRQQRVAERVERLEAEETIDHHRVQVWGQLIPVSGPMSGARFYRAAAERIAEFEEWARERDAEVTLPFDRERVTSEFTGEEYDLVRPPSTCVALYGREELVAVSPCRVDGEACAVDDVLGSLAGETEPDVEPGLIGLSP